MWLYVPTPGSAVRHAAECATESVNTDGMASNFTYVAYKNMVVSSAKSDLLARSNDAPTIGGRSHGCVVRITRFIKPIYNSKLSLYQTLTATEKQ